MIADEGFFLNEAEACVDKYFGYARIPSPTDMATLVKNKFMSSKKKNFIPSPRVLTPLGVRAIVEAVSENKPPCKALQEAFTRYKQLQTASK